MVRAAKTTVAAFGGLALAVGLTALGSFSFWASLPTTSIEGSRALRTPQAAPSTDYIPRKEPEWNDIFPGTNFTIGNFTPMLFYDSFSRRQSLDLTALLKRRDLRGIDCHEWLRTERNITLNQTEDELPIRELARQYGYDTLAFYNLRRAFVGTDLYHAIEKATCEIMSEEGTHVTFLGDSTVQGLNGILMSILSKCEKKVVVARRTRKDNELADVAKTGFFFERAYNPEFEFVDYSVPKGTKRELVIANFDGLHALSIFPSRKFELMFNGRRFFDGFGDFIRYQLWQLGRIEVDTFVVTLNVNSVDHERMKDGYFRDVRHYYDNTSAYVEECANSWNVPVETCRNSVMANEGANFLNKVIQSIVPVDVDVNAITRNQGHLSAERDGRHYKALGHLKVVQVVFVYILRRIESHLSSASRCSPQKSIKPKVNPTNQTSQ